MIRQFEPLFNVHCAECDHTPVVSLRNDEGNLDCTYLCGVCFFRDRLMIDPDEWNVQPESSE